MRQIYRKKSHPVVQLRTVYPLKSSLSVQIFQGTLYAHIGYENWYSSIQLPYYSLLEMNNFLSVVCQG